jgi:hypothetical protein
MKNKASGAIAMMARHLNKLTTAIVPTGAKSKDPLDPFIQTRKTKNDRTEIVVGSRTFFAGSLDITQEVTGADGRSRQEVSAVQVVAERRRRDSTKGGPEQEIFHPVKADLTLDKSVALFKRPEGRWGIRGGNILKASSAWLSENGFDDLDKPPSELGFRQIGSRECSVAQIMLKGKVTELSAPVLVERVRGPTAADDHYRLVTADLGRGDEVEPIEGAVKSDPLVTEAIRRIAEKKWQVGHGQEIAEAAAINALTAGAPIDTALAVSDDLLWGAKHDLGNAAAMTYAAAGAAVGAAHRAGMSADNSKAVARKVVASAEYLKTLPTVAAGISGGMNIGSPPGEPPNEVAYAEALRMGWGAAGDWQRDFSKWQRDMEQWPCKVIVAAHATASSNLAAARRNVAAQNRNTLGPDLSAINAAARELFIEKKVPKNRLVAVAEEAARKRIELTRKNAIALTAEARRTRDELDQLEIRAAELEVDLERNAPEPPDAWLQMGDVRDEGGIRTAVAESPSLKERKYQITQRELRYILRRRDTMLETLTRQMASARAARAEAADVSDDRTLQHAAAVKALLAADSATPGQQHAALAAAKAASSAMRAVGDELRAERAAAAAHLAALAGANEDDAEVAGRLMAQCHDVANGDLDNVGAQAARAAIVQVVTGSAGPDPKQQILAAAAATAALDSAKPNTAAAAVMGNAVAAAYPAPRDESDRGDPLFSVVDPDTPRGGVQPPAIPAIPMGYEAVESRFDPEKAVPVEPWGHAKIRQIQNLGLGDSPGHSTTSYIIEVMGPKGRYWADFAWSPNVNQLYGEISIKPSGASDDQIAAQVKTTIAYSGVTASWGSFEQRAKDLKATTDAAFAEVERLLTSRNHKRSFKHLHYFAEKSGHLANLLPHIKTKMEEEIRLFVQGRHSQPAFKKNISDMFITLVGSIEGDRSRKKAIVRHQIDSIIRVVTSTVLAGGLGGARVVAAFLE